MGFFDKIEENVASRGATATVAAPKNSRKQSDDSSLLILADVVAETPAATPAAEETVSSIESESLSGISFLDDSETATITETPSVSVEEAEAIIVAETETPSLGLFGSMAETSEETPVPVSETSIVEEPSTPAIETAPEAAVAPAFGGLFASMPVAETPAVVVSTFTASAPIASTVSSAQSTTEILQNTSRELVAMKTRKFEERDAIMARVNEINESMARQRKEAADLTKQAKTIDAEAKRIDEINKLIDAQIAN